MRAGEEFPDQLEKELNASRCVVVVWSVNSVNSRWVKEEANYGMNKNSLIPVFLDKVDPPFGFTTLHTVNLVRETVYTINPAYQPLVQSIKDKIGPGQHKQEPSAPTQKVAYSVLPDQMVKPQPRLTSVVNPTPLRPRPKSITRGSITDGSASQSDANTPSSSGALIGVCVLLIIGVVVYHFSPAFSGDGTQPPIKQGSKSLAKEIRQVVNLPNGNSVSFKMVKIPTGKFLMGEDENGVAEYVRECGRYFDDKAQCQKWAGALTPQHQVKVDSFLMGKYEVTQRQWRAVMGALPPGMGDLEARFKGDDLPVVAVSWNEVQRFLKKLGREYRLPSEAEWEYAARAGTTTAYAFGTEISPEIVNYDGNYPVGSEPKGLYREAPIAVGSLRKPNAWGLFDMHGNVWEWCADDWHVDYQGAPSAAQAWLDTSRRSYRPHRGGGWNNKAFRCRSADRLSAGSGDWADDIGFRLVRTLP